MSLPADHAVSDLIINPKDFQLVRAIGTGSYGAVYLVVDPKTGKYYAMKYIQCNMMTQTQHQYLLREIEIMSRANHPALLALRGYSLPMGGETTATIITDYMSQGSLFDMIIAEQNHQAPVKYNETRKNIIIIGIATGMRYLHSRQIVHRDLKPENILLNDNLEPCIGDFGFSKISKNKDGQNNTTQIGTPLYMAPEIFTNSPYDFKVDVYAFGIILYQVLTSLIPFADITNPIAFGRKICNGERPQYPPNFSPIFQNLIDRCWAQSPSMRPTFDDIVDYLFNPKVYIEGADLAAVEEYKKKVGTKQNSLSQLTNMIQNQKENISRMQTEFHNSLSHLSDEANSIRDELANIKKEQQNFQNELRSTLMKNQEIINRVIEEHNKLVHEINSLKKNRENDIARNITQYSSLPIKPSSSLHPAPGSLNFGPSINMVNSLSSVPGINPGIGFGSPGARSQASLQLVNQTRSPSGILLFDKLNRDYGKNVVDLGIVEITGTSKSEHDNYNLKNITISHWHDSWRSIENDSSWICFNFIHKKLHIEGYTITTSSELTGSNHLKNWMIEASEDGTKWSTLDRQVDNMNLNGPLRSVSILVQSADITYKLIRLKQSGPSHKGINTGFSLNHFDFYGTIV